MWIKSPSLSDPLSIFLPLTKTPLVLLRSRIAIASFFSVISACSRETSCSLMKMSQDFFLPISTLPE